MLDHFLSQHISDLVWTSPWAVLSWYVGWRKVLNQLRRDNFAGLDRRCAVQDRRQLNASVAFERRRTGFDRRRPGARYEVQATS
jgi:hypothetical protein